MFFHGGENEINFPFVDEELEVIAAVPLVGHCTYSVNPVRGQLCRPEVRSTQYPTAPEKYICDFQGSAQTALTNTATAQ